MAELAVSSVLQKLHQYLLGKADLSTGTVIDFNYLKNELQSIQGFLKDADAKAADDDEGGANEGVKTWVKQLREISFRIEDVIDYEAQKVNHSGSLPGKVSQKIKSVNQRHQIASDIQDIRSSLDIIIKRSKMYGFKHEIGSSCSRGSKAAARFHDPRVASFFIEETQVVAFEDARHELVSHLMWGNDELMLVSVVGMGGVGKTTLARIVFDDPSVKMHFDCRSFISVSQTYTIRELLTDMITTFCRDSNEPIPKDLQKMDDPTLITQVRQYLESKRYLVLFDDVWKNNFSDEIKHALVSNNKGSRIIVTTRIWHVAEYFKKYFPIHVHVHELKPLPDYKAWELFCNKAFRGKCPTELEEMSKQIVKKCGGLPLAIVAIAGLLSTKPKNVIEWKIVSRNLMMELERNVHLTSLIKILSLSYDDLPYHLKACMLYFGIYPEEDCTINSKRLARQWMAEGFVRHDEQRNLEEDVAEEYLTELIQRSLVQVSKVGFDGRVKSCQVHNLVREEIVRKMQDLSFCHIMHEYDEQVTVRITRRFSIAGNANNVLKNSNNSGLRAIFVFDKGELPKDFMDGLSAKFKLLKVLDFENSLLNYIPYNLENLFHLRYLNLSHTKVTVLPKSIGKLVNLETLDLRQTKVHELPKEINKLTKLRVLPVYYRNYEGHYSMLNFTDGVKMHKGIESLKSLQKLYFLEANHGGKDLIRELQELTQLRKLGIKCVQKEYVNALCAAIQKMNHLESLNITAKDENEILVLDFDSIPPPNLRVLNLNGRLTKLPNWIPKLNYLVKLRLGLSNFEHDPLDSLKILPNLLRLHLWDDAFAGDSLHFKDGGFQKLKEIDLTRLNKLSSISIDKEALPGLEHFRFKNNPQLKVLPKDLQNLKNLQFLGFTEMPDALVDSIDPEKDGSRHWVINHIPLVQIRQNSGSQFHEYKLNHIPTQINMSEISRFKFSMSQFTRRCTLNSINLQFILVFFFCFLSFVVLMLFYK